MSDFFNLAPVLVVGMVLGAVFFGGLWWTVRHAASSRWVALWFFGSLVVRTVIALTGFYLACGSDWRRWLAALLGFSIARVLVTRLTRSASLVAGDGSHAP
ncbi:MAG TPA: ATP synthase subunit I [Pseudomonas sp.]|uniref:ATP synthase subunit I n=1 Tax=Pseudomonas sp. TaxID=306 RepID=UPI002EDB2729